MKEPCPTRKSDTRKRHTTAFVVPLQSFGLLAQSKEERIAKMRKAKERKAKANMAKVLGFGPWFAKGGKHKVERRKTFRILFQVLKLLYPSPSQL